MEEILVKIVLGAIGGLVIAGAGIFKNYMSARKEGEEFVIEPMRTGTTIVACIGAGIAYASGIIPDNMVEQFLVVTGLAGTGIVIKDVVKGISSVELPAKGKK